MKRKFFLTLLCAALTLVPGCDPQTTLEKGPYLVFPGDNTRMTVLWQLDQTITCTLEWGASTAYGNSIQTKEYGEDHQHQHTITGLTPGTTYFYRVTAKKSHFTGSFKSAPDDAAANVKFLAYGDTRSYPADHDRVCARMVDTFTADPAFRTFALHSGDWVRNGDDEDDWAEQYFDRGQPNALEFQAAVLVMGCLGNHGKTGRLYRKYFPYNFEPDSRYFSYDYGPVHVTVLDQYISYTPGSVQYAWLEKDLASTSKTWKVLLFHEPGWSAGGGHDNNATVQEHIQPLCIQYGVKLVFTGHNHYYARCDVDGIQHITAGGGGAPLYVPSTSYPHVVVVVQDYNFCEIDIRGDRCFVTARDAAGNVIDSFSLDNAISPAVPANRTPHRPGRIP